MRPAAHSLPPPAGDVRDRLELQVAFAAGEGDHAVLVGNARVKIYQRTRTVAGHKYLTYEVCDYTSGWRRLRGFAHHQAVLEEAQ